jgi:hypothetical protein
VNYYHILFLRWKTEFGFAAIAFTEVRKRYETNHDDHEKGRNPELKKVLCRSLES